jgi:hypothetical protein
MPPSVIAVAQAVTAKSFTIASLLWLYGDKLATMQPKLEKDNHWRQAGMPQCSTHTAMSKLVKSHGRDLEDIRTSHDG